MRNSKSGAEGASNPPCSRGIPCQAKSEGGQFRLAAPSRHRPLSALRRPNRHRKATRRNWKERALAERDINGSITALTALARYGKPELQGDLIGALAELKPEDMSEEQKLGAVRVLSLALTRMGEPSSDLRNDLAEGLDKFYPNRNEPVEPGNQPSSDLSRQLGCR